MGDHYETLNVARTASTEVIREAYRALARLHHPDSGIAPDEERMRQINLASQVLTDPERRSRYDAELAVAAGDEGSASQPDEPLGDEGWGEGVDGDRGSQHAGPGEGVDRDRGSQHAGPSLATRLRLALSAGLAKLLERALKNLTVGILATAAAAGIVAGVTSVWGSLVDLLPWTGPSRQIATLEGHDDVVGSLAFSPDGGILATASADASVRLWDTETHEPVTMLSHDAPVEAVAFSPDGDVLATASGKEVRLWDPMTGGRVGTLDHRDLLAGIENGRVLALAFSPDGSVLATSPGVIVLWDVETGEVLAEPPPWRYSTSPLAFSADGTVLAAPTLGDELHLWDTQSLGAVATLEHDDSVNVVTFSPRGDLLATAGTSDEVVLWDAETYDRLVVLDHGSSLLGWVTALAFSPDGRVLASAGENHEIKLWDTDSRSSAGTLSAGRSGEEVGSLAGSQVRALAFSPDGDLLASADGGGRVVLWDADGG